jgi:MoaA/NifB/PqqE/SkfB family radical SAM enzyme
MRSSLRHHLADSLRRGDVAVLARGARRAAALHLGLAPDGPLLATYAITWRCPLRCAMCDLPSRAAREIPDDEVPRWIDAIAALAPLGLGFTGGEPLLRSALPLAVERAVGHGIVTHVNTSGVGLDEELAARLAGSGLASINVSLDHDLGNEHDALRGRRGAQARALEAIARMAAARDRTHGRLRIQATMAVSATTLRRIPAVDRLARESGADCLTLLPVHDFDAASPATSFDPRAAREAADTLAALPVENSRAYLRGIAAFLAGATTSTRCSAPRAALFVAPDGETFACTPSATERGRGVPATPETLASLFRSGALAATVPRERCSRCWWNCHRELDLALRLVKPPRLAPEPAATR